MLYFVQTSIPKKKQVVKGLVAIHGVGETTSKTLVGSLGLLEDARGIHLRRSHLRRFKALFRDYPRLLGAELMNQNKTYVQTLIDIQSYRGRRHKYAYPVRGQRTHTNAQTQKRLHRRWLINPHEKTKPTLMSTKKPQLPQKAKKGKGEKQKKKTVASKQTQTAKQGKYKI